MYERVIRAAMKAPWAMLPEKMEMMAGVLSERGAGMRWSREEIESRLALLAPGAREGSKARVAIFDAGLMACDYCDYDDYEDRQAERAQVAAAARAQARANGQKVIGVLPIVGVLQNRASEMDASSGVVGVNVLARRFREMVASSDVDAIVLDVDSPGGGVYGIAEFAALVREARQTKRVVAVADHMAASAAYWIASSADELWVSPSGEVGSIGVYTLHMDESKYLENEGVAVTAIQAGKYKTEGAPWAPLDDEAKAELQRQVDQYYGMFVADVAAGRRVSTSVVRGADFGQGRMVGAKDAVKRGMADRVGTVEDAVRRLAGGSSTSTSTKAALAAADADAFRALAEGGATVEELTNGVGGSTSIDRRRELELLRLRR